MRIIEMTPSHLAAALSVIKEIEYDPSLDTDWLRLRTLDDPTCSQDLLLLAEKEDRIVGFCFGCIREDKGVIKLFGVTDGHRRRGVGTRLLDALEARFAARRVEGIVVGAIGPNYFEPGVDLADTASVAFLMRRGYQSDRLSRVDMEVDLTRVALDTTESVERLVAQGIEVRRAAPDEIAAIAQFALETFSDGWRREVMDSEMFTPRPVFVALDGQRVVGFSVYDVCGLGRFGPTGTDPEYRHRGIGSTLLKMSLQSIRARGESVAEIRWAGPVDFYARAVDARIHRVFWAFTKSVGGE